LDTGPGGSQEPAVAYRVTVRLFNGARFTVPLHVASGGAQLNPIAGSEWLEYASLVERVSVTTKSAMVAVPLLLFTVIRYAIESPCRGVAGVLFLVTVIAGYKLGSVKLVT
jgi:hypothetical protein